MLHGINPAQMEEKSPFNSPLKKKQDLNKRSSSGSRTIEDWIHSDSLVVYPVWIGNLHHSTTVSLLRQFLETQIGRVVVSIHISGKRSSNERTYAFLNLPTAEKQILAVTLLDGQKFLSERLIVRSKRPSKFPQTFFGSTPISTQFKRFRDCVIPALLVNAANINTHSVKHCLEKYNILVENLPNRVWGVQCTLAPECHRTYCSFYHNVEEKEIGRILGILAENSHNGVTELGQYSHWHRSYSHDRNAANISVSRHTLLIEGLSQSFSTPKLTEMFEVFGEIDHIIVNPNNTCFLRMKHSQDARKIVHLLKQNNSGITLRFAPYAANQSFMKALESGSLRRGDNATSAQKEMIETMESAPSLWPPPLPPQSLSLSSQLVDWSRESIDANDIPLANLRLDMYSSGGHNMPDRPLRNTVYRDTHRDTDLLILAASTSGNGTPPPLRESSPSSGHQISPNAIPFEPMQLIDNNMFDRETPLNEHHSYVIDDVLNSIPMPF